MSAIASVAVIGGGTMGNGIAHVMALAGKKVSLIEVNQELLDRAVGSIRSNLERQAAKGVVTAAQKDAALALITPSTKLEDAGRAGIVIEAVTERLDVKQGIFSRLDAAASPETILATNTSSLPVTEIAAATRRPGKVIGMHFMNPVPLMKLVEIVRGVETSDETYEAVRALTLELGKTPVLSRDFPGFIANRILMPMINEACFALMEGVASAEDIDTVMKLGMNHPMGPLTLADFIGLDVCLSIMGVLHDGFGDPKYRACPLLKQMVAAGRLGRKSGHGFYRYEAKAAAAAKA